jgi:uncharacterized protein (TIGR00730 family)
MNIRRICVFCGSRPGLRPGYVAAAHELGTVLARRGIGLVYGGAAVGTMGVLADAALAAGGEVLGVIPGSLFDKEIAHRGVSELFVVESMHARKARMAELADAFITLPGGSGTLDEFFEIFTWAQLGFHHKPCGLINLHGYYDHLLGFLDHAVNEGFLLPDHRALIQVRDTPAALIDALGGARTPAP